MKQMRGFLSSSINFSKKKLFLLIENLFNIEIDEEKHKMTAAEG